VPIPLPESYNPAEFELVRRALRAGWKPSLPSFSLPNRKSDWKMFGTDDTMFVVTAEPNATLHEVQYNTCLGSIPTLSGPTRMPP